MCQRPFPRSRVQWQDRWASINGLLGMASDRALPGLFMISYVWFSAKILRTNMLLYAITSIPHDNYVFIAQCICFILETKCSSKSLSKENVISQAICAMSTASNSNTRCTSGFTDPYDRAWLVISNSLNICFIGVDIYCQPHDKSLISAPNSQW